MFCYKCGAELTDEAMFCYKCGVKVPSKVVDEDEKEINLSFTVDFKIVLYRMSRMLAR